MSPADIFQSKVLQKSFWQHLMLMAEFCFTISQPDMDMHFLRMNVVSNKPQDIKGL